MRLERSSGILMHPTSLPSRFGIGDFGPAAHAWVEWLATTGCRWWQVLPLGPTGFGDSPYQCFSAFAMNPYLVSLESLADDGLLHAGDLVGSPPGRAQVDFGAVIPWKLRMLDRAFARFDPSGAGPLAAEYRDFRESHASWLDDFALFMAIKQARGGGSWLEWPLPLRRREPTALAEAAAGLADGVARHVFRQFVVHRQWSGLRATAAGLGIGVIGDVPIFVAMDSADVWSRPELFQLDAERNPTVVAGVPPDYFAETGQMWGNPLYAWEAHAREGYAWWIERLRAMRNQVDLIRIDHFRGFVDYWEIPAGAPTAVTGRWVDGPGAGLFAAVARSLGGLPIIAEDLGELHDEVPKLRDELGLPGMKILQFAFDGDPENDFLPDNYPTHCVVYTGTHDNETTRGWYRNLDRTTRRRVREHLESNGRTIPWDMITEAWESRAALAIAPMQDFLGLDNSARMNSPGTPAGNWSWRMATGSATPALAARIECLNRRTGRLRGDVP